MYLCAPEVSLLGKEAVKHGLVGLAHDQGVSLEGGDQGCAQGSGARENAVGRWEGGVVIGQDKVYALFLVVEVGEGLGQLGVVQVEVKATDHGADAGVLFDVAKTRMGHHDAVVGLYKNTKSDRMVQIRETRIATSICLARQRTRKKTYRGTSGLDSHGGKLVHNA